MGDTAEPVAAFEEPFEAETASASAAARPSADVRARAPGGGSAARRDSSETATLVCAVSFAVALGVACGAWVNARLASAASAASHATLAPARLLPEPRVDAQTAHAPDGVAETAPVDSPEAAVSAVEETPKHDSDDPSDAQRARPPSEAGEGKGRAAAGVVASLTREAGSSGKATAERNRVESAKAEPGAGRARGRAAPCALYASAGSLTIRNGGAASLVVGGPGEQGHVTVTTPDWADIAVFSEGRAGGNGWLRYSVRSVGKRAGVYTVRLKTPCGSQNIPVTVARP
jgi:hypothetical protein